jgi:hypothetical protein
MNSALAPCSSCLQKTTHRILHSENQDDEFGFLNTYSMLECAGCHTISMCHEIRDLDTAENKYYPSPASRKRPVWFNYLFMDRDVSNLGWLLSEVYRAVDGGQHRLAAMGIRALLEQVMVKLVGDLKTFDEKLDELQAKGFISLIQRDAMRDTLEMGHAAMHRGFKPDEPELSLALDILEGILAPIYGHAKESSKLAKRIPPRAPKPKK